MRSLGPARPGARVVGLEGDLRADHLASPPNGWIEGVFLVDEVGYIPFSTVGAQLLFQFFADRHEVASVAISSNLFARFTEVFHDEEMTAAFLDRLTFKSTVMVIEGESYRLKESLHRQAAG